MKPAKEPKSRHPWRENIEALTMAVVVALLFKSFILEISKIPSGSMQPTLMGNPETGVFDRVVVDKLSMHFRDPERFEIIVFKHPLERSRVMVKRLVGMPGEELRIAGGDLWTRGSAEEPWSILRRPKSVQDEMWRRLDREEPKRSPWSVSNGDGWRISGRDVEARSPGRLVYRNGEPIRDGYLHGYPDAIRGEVRVRNPEWGKNTVGDLRLEGEARAEEGTEALVLELGEGAASYAFVLPGPAADESARPEIRADGRSDPGRTPANGDATHASAEEAWRLPAGRSVRFAVQNLDDELALEIEGETVATLEIDPAPQPEGSIAIELQGAGALLEDLTVLRDTHYLPHRGRTWEVEIPEGHYVLLGDNTQDSADSRDWEFVRFEWPEDGVVQSQRGNFRGGGENPSWGVGTDEAALTRFRDEWGEVHWFPRAQGNQGFQVPAPLVPRELVQGRALAVFWPIKPHRGIVRLGWLR